MSPEQVAITSGDSPPESLVMTYPTCLYHFYHAIAYTTTTVIMTSYSRQRENLSVFFVK